VQRIADMMGASSQTLEEVFLTAVRVRRAEKRARDLLAERKTERENAAPEADADAADAPEEEQAAGAA